MARARRDRAAGAGVDNRRLSAIAFIDIVGYSILMATDEARTHAKWMAMLNDVIRPNAARHHGRIVKSTGDGILAEFRSALDAVEWAQKVQNANHAAKTNTCPDEPAIILRISVHLGDVVPSGDDIYGDGVNVAARLQEFAKPGGIVLSEAVYDLVRGTAGARARDIGYQKLKNFEKPIRAYALDPEILGINVPALPRQSSLPSIAVLPLENLGGDVTDDYFADGIVEDIVASLAGLGDLMVISRASTLIYRGRHPEPADVGRTLGVRYVLTGSARRSARLIRVSTQLCDAHTGANIWTETTEAPPGELFDMQDGIVAKIVAGIAPNVRTAELRAALRKRPESFTSYDYTLRGIDIFYKLNPETYPQALEFFTKAMQEDGYFALPFAWAAWWHMMNIGQGWSTQPDDDYRQAGALAGRAIELDPRNALALSIYGHVKSYLFHDYSVGLIYLEQALQTGPSTPLAWLLSSATLSYLGRAEQAIRHAEHGLRLSPFDQTLYFSHNVLCLAHYANGDYEAAVKWAQLSASENPSFTANLRYLIASLVALDRMEEARGRVADLLKVEPDFRMEIWEKTRQPFKDPDLAARYVERLRRSGLPR